MAEKSWTLPEHVLFASEDNHTFLIDIPASIASAQEFATDENETLLSCLPRAEPYRSTEPKSAKARANVSNLDADEALHQIYTAMCTRSLGALRGILPFGPFHLPRRMLLDGPSSSRKRKSSTSDETTDQPDAHPDDATLYLQMTMTKSHENQNNSFYFGSFTSQDDEESSTLKWRFKPDTTNEWQTEPLEVGGEDNSLSYRNAGKTAITIELEPVTQSHAEISTCLLRIPSGSSWLLGPCHGVADFRRVARQYSPQGRFDLIYMDPPWPNRSAVRHCTRRNGYRTENNPLSVQLLLSRMDLDIHMKPAGFVAVWITNKPSCRAIIMELFLQWNVVLIEEWIYLKLAANGQPVTALDGKWRKPYEILLIAQSPSNRFHRANAQPTVTRRTIAAVPDLHSRKPCLKQLFQQLLPWPSRDHQDVLEIFARHLVAQWMSWGDEVIKYNWRHHWSSPLEDRRA